MATKTLSVSNTAVTRHMERLGSFKTLECIVDFSQIPAASAMAQNDILEAIAIQANTLVLGVRAEVLVVEGAARNFGIGDGSGTSSYITTQSANALAEFRTALGLTEGTPNTITGYTNGKYYSAADTICLLYTSDAADE